MGVGLLGREGGDGGSCRGLRCGGRSREGVNGNEVSHG